MSVAQLHTEMVTIPDQFEWGKDCEGPSFVSLFQTPRVKDRTHSRRGHTVRWTRPRRTGLRVWQLALCAFRKVSCSAAAAEPQPSSLLDACPHPTTCETLQLLGWAMNISMDFADVNVALCPSSCVHPSCCQLSCSI